MGAYHTFVYDGPLFERATELRATKVVRKGKHWFLNIYDYAPGTGARKTDGRTG